MAVRFSASQVGRTLLPRKIQILMLVRRKVDPRTILRLEGLGKLKNPITSSGFEPATCWLVA
jgi:hypothetical protein